MAQRRRRRNTGPSKLALGAAGVLGIATLGGAGYGGAVATGVVDAPDVAWLMGSSDDAAEPERLVQPPGTTPVYFSRVELPAITRISRDHLTNPATLEPTVQFFPAEKVPDHWMVDPSKLLGRILKDDKLVGRVFTENDLLPPGTREGFAGGVPAGYRAMVVGPTDISGLDGLGRYDHFDVFASGDYSRLVVEDGIIIQPARRMLNDDEERRLEEKRRTSRSRDPIDERQDIVIAVRPALVDDLSRSLAKVKQAKARARSSNRTDGLESLYAVIRSGNPEDDQTAGYQVMRPSQDRPIKIEMMYGMKRKMQSFVPDKPFSTNGTTVVRTQ